MVFSRARVRMVAVGGIGAICKIRRRATTSTSLAVPKNLRAQEYSITARGVLEKSNPHTLAVVFLGGVQSEAARIRNRRRRGVEMGSY